MENLKEMFAQRIKFQMEKMKKIRKNSFNFRKKTKKNLKKRGKTTTVLP